jgi:hypothetical protein
VRPLEDTERVARLLSSATEHEPTEVRAGSRDLHELAEQGPGGRQRDGLDGLESDHATQPGDLGSIKDLGEEAALAGPRLARDKGGRRRPLPTRAVDQLGQLIELLPTADERRAHPTSLQRPNPRSAAVEAGRAVTIREMERVRTAELRCISMAELTAWTVWADKVVTF